MKIKFTKSLLASAILAASVSSAEAVPVKAYQGNWEPTVKYRVGRVVTYDGKLYVSVLNAVRNRNVNHAPNEPNSQYWQ